MSVRDLPATHPTPMGALLQVQKVIPVYQREYVWDDALRDNFIDNILEAFRSETDYFIGSMVFQKREGGTYEVVDGQQRLTTIFILVCAMVKIGRNKDLDELNQSFLSEHGQQKIRSSVLTPSGATKVTALLQHADDTINEAYEQIAQGSIPDPKEREKKPEMVQNLYAASEELTEILENTFADAAHSEFISFINFVNTQLNCIHYVANDVDTALTIYARLNSSGKVLTKFEILKGMSFKEAEEDKNWKKLHKKWLATERLMQTKVKLGGKGQPRQAISEETLLLYKLYIDLPTLGQNTEGVGNPWVGTTQLGKVIFGKDMRDLLRTDAMSFVDSIYEFEEEVQALRKADASDDASITHYLKDIAQVAQTQSQWLMVGILLQRHFPRSDEAFRALRNMVFVFSFALTGSGSSSGIYKSLAKTLAPNKKSENPSEQKLSLAIQEIKGYIDRHWANFESAVRNLTYDTKSHHKLIRRILEFIEVELRRETGLGTLDNLGDQLGSRDVHIDHLQPTEVKDQDKKLEGYHQDQIGNLVLLEKSLNTALGDSAFESEVKQKTLPTSRYLGTKALTADEETLRAGKNKVLREHFSQYATMTGPDVEKRTSEILSFLKARLFY